MQRRGIEERAAHTHTLTHTNTHRQKIPIRQRQTHIEHAKHETHRVTRSRLERSSQSKLCEAWSEWLSEKVYNRTTNIATKKEISEESLSIRRLSWKTEWKTWIFIRRRRRRQWRWPRKWMWRGSVLSCWYQNKFPKRQQQRQPAKMRGKEAKKSRISHACLLFQLTHKLWQRV